MRNRCVCVLCSPSVSYVSFLPLLTVSFFATTNVFYLRDLFTCVRRFLSLLSFVKYFLFLLDVFAFIIYYCAVLHCVCIFNKISPFISSAYWTPGHLALVLMAMSLIGMMQFLSSYYSILPTSHQPVMLIC